ncbi:MAG: Uma2 family endonuclease [Gammaproteobacteria bacterium]|nr:Uma2 family endonuclease [Gammaproteobacteria bacterium]
MPRSEPQPARKPRWPRRAVPKPQQSANRPDPLAKDDEARYPDLGVPPMTSDHWQALMDGAGTLQTRYADRDDVFVGANLTLYYLDGSEERAIQPDVFVSFGSPKRPRRVWLAWEEGKLPDFVLEVASKSTHPRDEGEKRAIYERMGIAEYWQFDPTGEYLNPALQGLRLNANGTYEPLPLTTIPSGMLYGVSSVLDLHVCRDGSRLRLFDPAAGEFLPTNLEKDDLLARERHAAVEKDRALEAAVAEIKELKRRLGE